MTSTAESVRTLASLVGDVGGRWMLHNDVIGSCKEVGYPNGYAYYFAGRGGVLGDVEADVVGSAFAFFEPALVAKMWNREVAVEGARASAARYGGACVDWGRARLVDFAGASRLAELIHHVVDTADPAGMALFAGWRGEPRPDDPAGLAYLIDAPVARAAWWCAHRCRRCHWHLTPRRGAHVTWRLGRTTLRVAGAVPRCDAPRGLRAETESLTDTIMTRVFDHALNADETAELGDLMIAVKAHLDERS